MHHEDLLLGPEVANRLQDLHRRVPAHLRHGALAEVQPVVRTRRDTQEALEAVYAPQHPMNAAQPRVVRHRRVVRVTGHPHAVLLRHGNDPLQEVGHVLPHLLRRHRTGLGEGVVSPLIDVEVAIGDTTTSGRSARARYADQTEIVFQRRNTGLARGPEVLLDDLDFGVAARESAHNPRKPLLRHVIGLHVQREHVERDAERFQVRFRPLERRHVPRAVLLLNASDGR